MNPKIIKASKDSRQSGEVRVEVLNEELVITWMCGGQYRFSPQQAHEQFERLCMVADEYEGVGIADMTTNHHSYHGVVVDGKFVGSDHPPTSEYDRDDGSISWKNFRKAIEAALKEIPVPDEKKGEVME